MGKIVVLDELTINQIAAGEVIERPASVVKELLENSIDAGATSVSVEVKNGGIKQIKIIDNGSGIAKDDLQFAFERHATSKIRNADDLETVKSMGFRGEALASIASISHIELVTKTQEDFTGNKIVLEGGNILEQEETGAQNGTTITISNLFYNTPVRYKFLKKDFTELGYIEDAVKRIALANPNVAIRLSNENKTIIKTNGNGDLKTAIYSIYGKETTDGLIDIDYTYEGIRVSGVIGKPEIARGNRSYQMFFVNKRYIKDKTLSAGVDQAFKGLLPIGKFGFLVLNLEIEPSKIDVNVHPTKLEIRFQEEQKVFKAVYHAIREGLLKGDLVKNSEKTPEENNTISFIQPNSNIEEKKLEPVEIKTDIIKEEKIEEQKVEEQKEVVQEEIKNETTEKMKENPETVEESREEDIDREFLNANSFNRKEELNFDDLDSTESRNMAQIQKLIGSNIPSSEAEFDMQATQRFTPITEEKKKEEKGPGLFGLFRKKNEEEIVEHVENNAIEEIFSYKSQNQDFPYEDKSESNNEYVSETQENLDFEEMYNKTFGIKKEEKEGTNVEGVKENAQTLSNQSFTEANNMSLFETDEEYRNVPAYTYCGTVFSTYLIIQMGNEMYLIDQHAAHERILYEEIKKNYYDNPAKDSQIMLLPDIINLSHKEKNLIKENLDLFKQAGFMLEEFGENTIRLIGVPSICMDMDTKQLFLELLDSIETVAITARQEKEDRFIATIACKAAIKAGMNLSKEEVDNLLKKLLILPNPFTCPHGRPTAIKMSKTDLEKKFFRRK